MPQNLNPNLCLRDNWKKDFIELYEKRNKNELQRWCLLQIWKKRLIRSVSLAIGERRENHVCRTVDFFVQLNYESFD